MAGNREQEETIGEGQGTGEYSDKGILVELTVRKRKGGSSRRIFGDELIEMGRDLFVWVKGKQGTIMGIESLGAVDHAETCTQSCRSKGKSNFLSPETLVPGLVMQAR